MDIRLDKIHLIIFSLFCFSCSEKTPAPDASFTATVNRNVVKFEAEATNTEAFEWNFGDGSQPVAEEDPVHTFTEFGRDYSVKLKLTGRGGVTEVDQTVAIPPMTPMEMIAGTGGDLSEKKWRMSSSSTILLTRPDTLFTLVRTWPAGYLSSLGFTSAYLDEYVFSSNGSFAINLNGNGLPAGLGYCTANGIPNIIPGEAAREANLTLMTPAGIPAGMTFGLNEGRNMVVSIATKNHSDGVTYRKVMTLTFSYGAFIGIRDWTSELIIRELTASRMTLACFVSNVPSGRATGVIIFSLDAVR